MEAKNTGSFAFWFLSRKALVYQYIFSRAADTISSYLSKRNKECGEASNEETFDLMFDSFFYLF